MRRLLLPTLAILTLAGCSGSRPTIGACAAYLTGGAVMGGGAGYVGSRVVGGDSTSTTARAASTAGGAVLGAAAGYALCTRVHRQREDIERRFLLVEQRLASERAALAAAEDRISDLEADAAAAERRAEEETGYTSEKDEGVVHEVEVIRDQAVKLDLNASALFATGSVSLSPSAYPHLDAVAENLVAFPGSRVEVLGHADASGNPDRNQTLSRQRAESVARYLLSRGVPRDLIRPVGLGSSDPVAPNTTAAGRARNRRVEIYLYPAA